MGWKVGELHKLLNPSSVVVVGASRKPGKVGHSIFKNLLESKVRVYPVNSQAEEVLGVKCYPSVLNLPEVPDLAVIVVPRLSVPQVMENCGKKGIKYAVIITAGFKEIGEKGAWLEEEVVEVAKRYGIRFIGPNCLGVINAVAGINASFAPEPPLPGKIAFISQSGALATSILDWSVEQGVGFSKFISIGNKADVDEVDLLKELKDDPDTGVILLYIESITRGPEFIETAYEVSKTKPIIVLRLGTSEAGARAVSSHTGSLAGSEAAYSSAFKQSNVIRVGSVEELFDLAMAFATQPLPSLEKGVAIVTNAGGPGIAATDACSKLGLELASFSSATVDRLRQRLPKKVQVRNPLDLIGDAEAERYRSAFEELIEDESVGGLLVILTPQDVTEPEKTATYLAEVAKRGGKPVVACWMGGKMVREGIEILKKHGIPNYATPEGAAYSLYGLYLYARLRQKAVGKTRKPPEIEIDEESIRKIIQSVRSVGRQNLLETEAIEILRACGIPTPRGGLAHDLDEAMKIAEEIRYPLVMKLVSPQIVHKSDIGAVRVGIESPREVEDAFAILKWRAEAYAPFAEVIGVLVQEMVMGGKEVVAGMYRDPCFGPVIMFGLGGIYIEAVRDVSFRVAPLTREDAEEMVREIKMYKILRGFRGEPPSDISSIVDVLLRLSTLSTRFAEILEIDINPLIVLPEGRGCVAVDARMRLSPE